MKRTGMVTVVMGSLVVFCSGNLSLGYAGGADDAMKSAQKMLKSGGKDIESVFKGDKGKDKDKKDKKDDDEKSSKSNPLKSIKNPFKH